MELEFPGHAWVAVQHRNKHWKVYALFDSKVTLFQEVTHHELGTKVKVT